MQVRAGRVTVSARDSPLIAARSGTDLAREWHVGRACLCLAQGRCASHENRLGRPRPIPPRCDVGAARAAYWLDLMDEDEIDPEVQESKTVYVPRANLLTSGKLRELIEQGWARRTA